ncbi:MAG TPA: hypothetical protein VN442_23065 [Bryobacteraceae bacterium]|nr:hypothetical protein [Bryobacteraceae bacterium]
MHESVQTYGGVGVERRLSTRFPIAEEIRFRVLDRRGEPHEGTGLTVDMSRSGVLFTTSSVLAPGRLLEVSVNWPVALDGTCPLKFVAVGHVVRTGRGLAAVKIEKYQFKTRGKATAARA